MKTILVGIDFSDPSNTALDHAITLAKRCDAELILGHATSAPGVLFAQAADDETRRLAHSYAEQAVDKLEELASKLAEREVTARVRVIEDHPDPGLADAARDAGADLLVLGTHGRTGLKRFMLGSVAERAVRLAPCDALVARGPISAGGYRRTMVATDFSDTARTALERALELTVDDGAVELFHSYGMHGYDGISYSIDPVPVEQELADEARRLGDETLARYKTDRVNLSFASDLAAPVDGIVRRAEDTGCEAIFIGSHGRRGWRRWLLGSVAETTVRHAPCAVFVVRAPESDDAD